MKVTAKSRSEVVDPLIGIHMSECERQAARAHLRHGERIADFMIAAITTMRSVMRGVARAFRLRARTRPAN